MAKSAIQEVKQIDSFDILIPDTPVKLRNKEVTLVPFKVKDGKKVQKLIASYVEKFAEKEIVKVDGEVYFREKDNLSFIASLLKDENLNVCEDIGHLTSFCTTDLSSDEIKDLGADEALVLLTAIIKMNTDFFPLLFEMMGLGKKAQKTTESESSEPKTGDSESTD